MIVEGAIQVGSEILVNTATEDLLGNPQITTLPNDGFVAIFGNNSQGVGGVRSASLAPGLSKRRYLPRWQSGEIFFH